MPEENVLGEIELGFRRSLNSPYEVEIRVFDPDPANQALQSPVSNGAAIDLAVLRNLEGNPDEYGVALGAAAFSGEQVKLRYAKAKGSFDGSYRVRILIRECVPELHHLRWELLRDPDGMALGTSESVLLSRFPQSRDCRELNLRPKAELKALIAIAAPSNLSDLGFAKIVRTTEIERAKQAFGKIESTVLSGPVTAQRIADSLRGIDILYLMCHGQKSVGEAAELYLENTKGQTDLVPAEELVKRVADLPEPPRLVVLLSCESAGSTADRNTEAQNALAPRLADAGVPAVLAMHGKISMDTVETAVSVFLREVAVDGQIDRALAAARGAVRDRSDFWMPALFSRLKSGRIWYEPGFTSNAGDLKVWSDLCDKMRAGECVPVLGPGFGEELFGGYRRVSSQLAEKHHFPGQAQDRFDLAKVTQYLMIQNKRESTELAVERQVAENLAGQKTTESLKDLLDKRVPGILADPDNPYRILANLPVSLYICASPEPTMYRVLKAAERNPEPLAGAWRSNETRTAKQPQAKMSIEPTPKTPWVYHVFGAFVEKDSLVLTEDDFFDYLIATSRAPLIPAKVEGSIIKSSLLLLGFRLDDWTFRILFRKIMALNGVASMQGFSHVGVQVDPDATSFSDANRARAYLSAYFRETRVVGKAEPEIEVYWGSSADFLKEFWKRYSESTPNTVMTPKPEGDSAWD